MKNIIIFQKAIFLLLKKLYFYLVFFFFYYNNIKYVVIYEYVRKKVSQIFYKIKSRVVVILFYLSISAIQGRQGSSRQACYGVAHNTLRIFVVRHCL